MRCKTKPRGCQGPQLSLAHPGALAGPGTAACVTLVGSPGPAEAERWLNPGLAGLLQVKQEGRPGFPLEVTWVTPEGGLGAPFPPSTAAEAGGGGQPRPQPPALQHAQPLTTTPRMPSAPRTGLSHGAGAAGHAGTGSAARTWKRSEWEKTRISASRMLLRLV